MEDLRFTVIRAGSWAPEGEVGRLYNLYIGHWDADTRDHVFKILPGKTVPNWAQIEVDEGPWRAVRLLREKVSGIQADEGPRRAVNLMPNSFSSSAQRGPMKDRAPITPPAATGKPGPENLPVRNAVMPPPCHRLRSQGTSPNRGRSAQASRRGLSRKVFGLRGC